MYVLAAPRPRLSWMKTFLTKLMILSFSHFPCCRVNMSRHLTLCSPPPGLALTATGSSASLRWHRSFNRYVIIFPVSLGVTPLLIVPMESLVTAAGAGSFLRKSSRRASSVSTLTAYLRFFPAVPLASLSSFNLGNSSFFSCSAVVFAFFLRCFVFSSSSFSSRMGSVSFNVVSHWHSVSTYLALFFPAHCLAASLFRD